MENTSQFTLSDYQRAILNQMGVSSWQLATEEQTQVQADESPLEVAVTSSSLISKEDALAKLKQLKVQTQTIEPTDSVLVTFSPSDSTSPILTDVFIALGLESKPQKHISIEQLSHYSGYPLSWTQGEKVSFEQNKLITPALAELQHPATKKQLWQQLQACLSVATS